MDTLQALRAIARKQSELIKEHQSNNTSPSRKKALMYEWERLRMQRESLAREAGKNGS